MKYITEDLINNDVRRRIIEKLRGKAWRVFVKKIYSEKDFGFASHPDFDKLLYFKISKIRSKSIASISIGKALRVKIMVNKNPKSQDWQFAISNGDVIES